MTLSELRNQPATIWFTPRERQILKGICLRLSNKEIAADLDITAGTVKNVITVLLRRMDGLKNRSDLLAWCQQHPDDLIRGLTNDNRLHDVDCDCGSPGCSFAEQIAA